MNTLKLTLLVGAASLGLGAAHAQTAYLLGDGGGTLVTADPTAGSDADDGATGTSITLDGAALSLDAITFRPQTGELYGYDGATGSLYTIDAATGAATFVFQSDDLPGGDVQFDTNPNLDAFRFVNGAGENVVYFPQNTANGNPDNAGRLIAVTVPGEADNISPITYGEGYDVITTALGTPVLVSNGYTNQLPLTQAQAQTDDLEQYVLDATTDTIAILNNNAGTVDFEAFVQDADGNAIDFDLSAAFDVFTDGDTDIGYALLTIDGDQTLFSVDLDSYVFTRLFGFDGDFGALTSLAVFGNIGAAVPIPAAGLLFAGGAVGFGAMRRRKAKADA